MYYSLPAKFVQKTHWQTNNIKKPVILRHLKLECAIHGIKCIWSFTIKMLWHMFNPFHSLSWWKGLSGSQPPTEYVIVTRNSACNNFFFSLFFFLIQNNLKEVHRIRGVRIITRRHGSKSKEDAAVARIKNDCNFVQDVRWRWPCAVAFAKGRCAIKSYIRMYKHVLLQNLEF